jgi:hypothetical protein
MRRAFGPNIFPSDGITQRKIVARDALQWHKTDLFWRQGKDTFGNYPRLAQASTVESNMITNEG